MNRVILTTAVIVAMAISAWAQNIRYVDTDKILNQIPEYNKAQEEIDGIADGWRAEVDKRYKDIDQLYRDYQNNQVFYTEDMKKQKQTEIETKEKAVKEFQKQKFGYEGEMFQKKQELIKPIQDRVYKEIQKIATESRYDIVLDKSSGITMLFSNPKYDITTDVLKALGVTQLSSENK